MTERAREGHDGAVPHPTASGEGASEEIPMRNPHWLVGACMLAAACGSSGEKTFTYGAPRAVTPEEQAAADAGAAAAYDALVFAGATDPAVAGQRGSALAGMPESMGAYVFDASVAPSTASPAAWPVDPCVVPGPGRVDFVDCARTVDGVTVTLAGSIERDATGKVIWRLTSNVNGSVATDGGSLTVAGTAVASGWMAVGASTIEGLSEVVASAAVSGPGLPSVSAEARTRSALDVTYQRDPAFCINGGTIELTREWTRRPPGMPTAPPYDDRGYLFTWTGCGAVEVAHSR